MYNFILGMWKRRRISEELIRIYVQKGHITQEQADEILATPQNPQ